MSQGAGDGAMCVGHTLASHVLGTPGVGAPWALGLGADKGLRVPASTVPASTGCLDGDGNR